VQAYCDVYGDSLLDGWGKRRSEWQFALGMPARAPAALLCRVHVQPQDYANLTVQDQLGSAAIATTAARTSRRARTAT
jgi:hypothetical protein